MKKGILGLMMVLLLAGHFKPAQAFSNYDFLHSEATRQPTNAQITFAAMTSIEQAQSISMKYTVTGDPALCGATVAHFDLTLAPATSGFTPLVSPTFDIPYGSQTGITFDISSLNLTFEDLSTFPAQLSLGNLTFTGSGSCINAGLFFYGGLYSTYGASFPYFGAFDQSGTTIPYLTFNGNNFAPEITFQNPPFQEGFESLDFQLWQTCVSLSTGNSGGGAGYYKVIGYGTSTPDSFFDDTRYDYSPPSTTPFYYPIYSIPFNQCTSNTKANLLPPGDYVAEVGLYRHMPLSGDSFVATSSLLSFTITAGPVQSLPGEAPPVAITCQYTPSNTGINTIDDVVNGTINGFCSVLTYLLIPSDTYLNNFSNLWTAIDNKPPFGYFSSITGNGNTTSPTTLSGFATSTASSATTSLPALAFWTFITVPLDLALALLVTISFMFWVFFRIKSFHF